MYIYMKRRTIHTITIGGSDNIKNGIFIAYADWCGHCVTFKPLFEKFINSKSMSTVPVFAVRDDNHALIDVLGITSFPALGYFHNGRKYTQTDRSSTGLKTLLKKYSALGHDTDSI